MSFFTDHLHTPVLRDMSQPASLCLRLTDSGCALLDEYEKIMFEAGGRDARRQCLTHASALGVLYVRFDELPVAAQTEPPRLHSATSQTELR
jgi:hypothetical protein